jgi:aquaporin Z
MLQSIKKHWNEYLIEAAGLSVFMLSACLFATLLQYPGSPVRQAIGDATVRRLLMGLAMGLTAAGVVYSPWGKQSGAHLNPSLTLTFLRLGKVAPWDAVFYILAQFAGGIAGVLIAAGLLGHRVADPPVHYVVTMPGTRGVGVAFLAEFTISFVLMSTILIATNHRALARYTGLLAGALVALFILIEDPFSGMSMNPARTFGAASSAKTWTALWIYFTAPPIGMLLAAQLYQKLRGRASVFCAKLHHQNDTRCIFCEYRSESGRAPFRAKR